MFKNKTVKAAYIRVPPFLAVSSSHRFSGHHFLDFCIPGWTLIHATEERSSYYDTRIRNQVLEWDAEYAIAIEEVPTGSSSGPQYTASFTVGLSELSVLGNASPSATPLATNTIASGSIDYPGDVDMFDVFVYAEDSLFVAQETSMCVVC